MGRLLTFLLGIFAAAVFVASVIVHILSLIPGTVLPLEQIVWLHALTLLVFFLMLGHTSILRNRALRRGCNADDVHAVMQRQAPCGVWMITTTTFLYVVLNFGYFLVN